MATIAEYGRLSHARRTLVSFHARQDGRTGRRRPGTRPRRATTRVDADVLRRCAGVVVADGDSCRGRYGLSLSRNAMWRKRREVCTEHAVHPVIARRRTLRIFGVEVRFDAMEARPWASYVVHAP